MSVLFDPVAEQRLHRLADLPVQLAPAAQQDGVVGRIPRELVLEDVFGLHGHLSHQLDPLQGGELQVQ